MYKEAARVRDFLIDLIYPPRCPYCGRVIALGERTCGTCTAEPWRIAAPRCGRCGRNRRECTCSSGHAPKYSQGVAAPFYFGGTVRSAVYRLKRRCDPVRLLSEEMYRSLRESYGDLEFDRITCIPMSRRARRARGFNQSRELAVALARLTGIRFEELLVKHFDTQVQHSLTAEERRANVLGAYDVRGGADPSGLRILLVDDVFTTGSTAIECAKMLCFSGAQSVHILCAAITLPEKREYRVDKRE